MRIPIDVAVDYLLAIPAHRSSNEAHRQLGKIALDELREYRELGTDETEKAYNKAVIAATLSAARAFSVERDRIAGIWRSIDEIKARHLRLLAASRELSPLAKKNYWAKAITLLSATGVSFGTAQVPASSAAGSQTSGLIDVLHSVPGSFVICLLLAVLLLELVSHLMEWVVGAFLERRGPIEKQAKWQELTMGRYAEFSRKFVLECIDLHKAYYSNETKIQGHDIQSDDGVQACVESLVKKHLYFNE